MLTTRTALRFQPTKRPQQQPQKAKPRHAASRVAAASSNSVLSASTDAAPTDITTSKPSAAASSTAAPPAQRPTLADFAGSDDEDLNEYYAGVDRARPERGGRRRKRKKNKEQGPASQDWDDIYDPSRPNSYEEYKGSEERWREVSEWKHRLYAHRMKRRRGSGSSDRSGDEVGRGGMGAGGVGNRSNALFAPPPNLNDDGGARPPPRNTANAPDDPTGDDAFTRRMRMSRPPIPATGTAHEDDYSPPPAADSSAAPPPPPPPADVPDDPSGEDAYARRLRLSNTTPSQPVAPPPPPPSQQPPPPPPTEPATAPAISRAPVRYNLPAPAEPPQPPQPDVAEAEPENEDEEEEEEEEEAPRSSRPGQKGFAQRLMSKYGWSKGSGLGATGTGIATPLAVQVEKRKRKSDGEGGGFVGPGGKGRIVGGKKAKGDSADSEGAPEKPTRIVRLEGMCGGVDLDDPGEMAGLIQEIGDECGEKYGNVERVRIERGGDVPVVLVQFTSPLSGLRAVGALQGRMFAGTRIAAGFAEEE